MFFYDLVSAASGLGGYSDKGGSFFTSCMLSLQLSVCVCGEEVLFSPLEQNKHTKKTVSFQFYFFKKYKRKSPFSIRGFTDSKTLVLLNPKHWLLNKGLRNHIAVLSQFFAHMLYTSLIQNDIKSKLIILGRTIKQLFA